MTSGFSRFAMRYSRSGYANLFFPHSPMSMSQREGPELEALNLVIGHGTANSQGMFPLLSNFLLSDFTTYVLGAATDRASQRDENHRPEPERDDSSGARFSLYQDMTEEQGY
jgi:hypothetical protein